MTHSDSTVKLCLSLHWQKFTSMEIARTVSRQLSIRITARSVREIVSTMTLRHHGTPARRQDMGLGNIAVTKREPKHHSPVFDQVKLMGKWDWKSPV
jgi:hypothetical protein